MHDFYCAVPDKALSVLSLEMGVDDRLQTMKGVGVLHSVEVEVLAQHIIIHPLCLFLFSFPFYTFSAILFITPFFPHLFFGLVPSQFHSFCLCPPSPLSFPIVPISLVISRNLQVVSISPSSPIRLLFATFLPTSTFFPHSANHSTWHLSNSPCTHSVMPLIACSFTLPFFPSLARCAMAV